MKTRNRMDKIKPIVTISLDEYKQLLKDKEMLFDNYRKNRVLIAQEDGWGGAYPFGVWTESEAVESLANDLKAAYEKINRQKSEIKDLKNAQTPKKPWYKRIF